MATIQHRNRNGCQTEQSVVHPRGFEPDSDAQQEEAPDDSEEPRTKVRNGQDSQKTADKDWSRYQVLNDLH